MDDAWVWLLALAGALVVLLVLAVVLVVRQPGEARLLAQRIGRLPWRRKGALAWALVRDARVPLWVRAIVPGVVAYLLMPIDIIPDFIPVVGHLDDVLVVLVAAGLLVRFAPSDVLEEHLDRLEQDLVGTDL
ncbi:MAG: DUF1232 domain-containing protein [Chloroflexi bacterium]|nr:DUF1232 domain-containing protein [Chloroflexota bacterium]